MKTMKKVLFLVLALAMVMTTVALAATENPTYKADSKEEAYEWIQKFESWKQEDGTYVHTCGKKVTVSKITTMAELKADCTLTAELEAKCECGVAWTANFKRAEAHTWGAEEVGETVKPTCNTPGKITKVVKCTNNSDCKATKETVTENTPAAYGHTMLKRIFAEVAAIDYDASVEMTRWQAAELANYIEQYNGDAAAANFSDVGDQFQMEHMQVDWNAPTTCKGGDIKIWCDECGTVLFEQDFAGRHHWDVTGNVIGAFPTCDTPGELYVECKDCHEQLKVYLPAYGHLISNELLYIRQDGKLVAYTSLLNVYNNGKIKNVNEVTNLYGKDFIECEAYQLVRACELPKLKLNELTIYVEDYVKGLEEITENIELTDINAIVKALVEGITNVDLSVSKCDHIEYAFGAKVMPALWDHVYDLNNLKLTTYNADGSVESLGEFTKTKAFEGNCTEPYHYYLRCDGCKKWTDKVVGPEPSHNWDTNLANGKVIKDATCSANGEIEVKCTIPNCEGTKIVPTEKLDHQLEWHHTGSCRVAGKLIEQCNVCLEITQEIDVKAWHDPSKRTYAKDKGTNVELVKTITKGGTEVIHLFDLIDCTKDGEVKYTCGVCKQTITEKIDKTGHSYNVDKFIEDLKDGKLQNNGENKDYFIINNEKDEELSAFNTEKEGIIYPTCSTYGYVYLECMNPNCKHVDKVKYADKLNHFDKMDDKNSTIVESTCTEKGIVTKVCLCGYTETVEKALAAHKPTKVDGKDVCVVCGTELKLETEVKFDIQTTEMKVSSTSVSGRGVISRWESFPLLHGKLFARINYNFTLDNGETVAYVACVPVDMDGSFRAASPSCPYGATLTNVAIMITTDADAQDKVISDVVNMGIVVVK